MSLLKRYPHLALLVLLGKFNEAIYFTADIVSRSRNPGNLGGYIHHRSSYPW